MDVLPGGSVSRVSGRVLFPSMVLFFYSMVSRSFPNPGDQSVVSYPYMHASPSSRSYPRMRQLRPRKSAYHSSLPLLPVRHLPHLVQTYIRTYLLCGLHTIDSRQSTVDSRQRTNPHTTQTNDVVPPTPPPPYIPVRPLSTPIIVSPPHRSWFAFLGGKG